MKIDTRILIVMVSTLLFMFAISQTFGQTQNPNIPWKVPITVSVVGDSPVTIAFGTKVGATDTFDIGIDIPSPPPPPQNFDTFFQINHPIVPNLREEFRSNTLFQNSWDLIITLTNGSNGSLSWDASEFPALGKLEIREGTTVLADMLSVNNLNFTGDKNLTIPFSIPLVFFVERTTGDVFAAGAFTGGGADLAERINVSEPVEPGDVVELDPANPTYYRKARGTSDLIAGVITTAPGFTLGNNPEEMAGADEKAAGRPMLALMGRVPVKVTTENGTIRPGDLLTVASKPGYAIRCADAQECDAVIIGKALEGLESGEGKILVLVMSH